MSAVSTPFFRSNQQDQINLISGTYTAPFINHIYMLTGGDTKSLNFLYGIISFFLNNGNTDTAIKLLQAIYDISGFDFSTKITQLCQHPERMEHYLFSFLCDFEEIIQDHEAEAGEDN